MGLRKKYLWRFLGVCLCALLLLLALAPLVLNLKPVKSSIRQLLQEQTGADLTFDSLDISYLPEFEIEVQQLHLKYQSQVKLTIATLALSPDLGQLLLGRVRLLGLSLENPQLTLNLPAASTPSANPEVDLSSRSMLETVATALSPFRNIISDLSVRVRHADFVFSRQGDERLRVRQGDLTLEMAETDPETLDAKLEIELQTLETRGQGVVRPWPLRKLELSLHQQAELISAELTNFELFGGRSQGQGQLNLSVGSPSFTLALRGGPLNLDEVSHFVQSFLGEDAPLRAILERVKAGEMNQFKLSSQGDSLSELVALPQLALEAQVQGVNFVIPGLELPLSEAGAQILLADGVLNLKEFSGSIGQSTLKHISASLMLNEELQLKVKQAMGVLSVGELYPRIRALVEPDAAAQWPQKLVGEVGLKRLKLEGSLLEPGRWSFGATGSLQNVRIEHPFLPAPMHIEKGDFDLSEKVLSLNQVNAELLDGRLLLSGNARTASGQFAGLDLQLQGRIGAQLATWLQEQAKVPEEIRISPPLQLDTLKLAWQPASGGELTTEFQVNDGPQVTADVRFKPESLNVRRLTIKDEDSSALFSVRRVGDLLQGRFSGKLQQQTVNRLFFADKFTHGWLQGEVKFSIPADRSLTRLDGQLQGGEFLVPLPGRAPLSLDEISLSATGTELTFEKTRFSLGKQRFELDGKLGVNPAGFELDLDVKADEVSLDNFIRKMNRVKNTPDSNPEPRLESWDLPVSGEVRLAIESFTWEQFSLAPFHGTVSLAANKIGLRVSDAAICGISTTGEFVASPEQNDLLLQLSAENQELAGSYRCFTKGQGLLTGQFNLTSEFRASGELESLADNLSGSYAIHVAEGEVKRSPVIAKLLEVLNLTSIVKGKLPDLSKQSVGYKSIDLQGQLQGSHLLFDEFHMNGETLDLLGTGELDLVSNQVSAEILAAPLKIVDSVIKHIPLVNYLLAGSLVSIPVRINGDLFDPQIRVMSVKSVGSGLLGLAERVLKLPVKVIEPLIPEAEAETTDR